MDHSRNFTYRSTKRVVCRRHLRRVVDSCTAHGNKTVVALHRNGNGHIGAFFVLVHPDPKGDEFRIQLRLVLQFIRNPQIFHCFLLSDPQVNRLICVYYRRCRLKLQVASFPGTSGQKTQRMSGAHKTVAGTAVFAVPVLVKFHFYYDGLKVNSSTSLNLLNRVSRRKRRIRGYSAAPAAGFFCR